MDRDEVIEAMARAILADRGVPAPDNLPLDHVQFGLIALRDATAALTAAEPFFAEQWRPIEEAKKDGQRYLLWSPKWTGTACGIWQNAWTVGYDLPPFLYQPTHFMHLPAPPVTKGEGE